MYARLPTMVGDVSVAPRCLRQRTLCEGPAATTRIWPSPCCAEPLPQGTLLRNVREARAAPEPVHRGPGRLAAAHVHGPEPASGAGGRGDQVSVEARVVEVAEGDRRRKLDQ